MPRRSHLRRNEEVGDISDGRRGETTVDRISLLPDSLLVHILAFLPIEDAIQTQVLSKTWQYLWTSLPSLLFRYCHYDYQYDDYDAGRISDFIACVDNTLALSDCSKLKKFGVDFDYEARFASNVNSWIHFATRLNVEELQLDLHSSLGELLDKNRFALPQVFFTNSSFRELHFCSCSVVPKVDVVWKSLMKLSIGYVKLSEDVIHKILEGSPVLETLELYYFYGFTCLNVSSKASLKKLILTEFWDFAKYDGGIDDEDESVLEISAPSLLSLKISGSLRRNSCRLVDVTSLVDATLDCDFDTYRDDCEVDYQWQQNILRGLLEGLGHVKNLKLGNWAVQVLSIMEVKGLRAPVLSKCECLTLDTHLRKSVLHGIASLLESSSHVETLVLAMSSTVEYFFGFNFNREHYWASRKWTFKCSMLHLKTINFAALWYYGDGFLSFVQYLLENARVLHKMVINTPRIQLVPNGLFQAAQKLLSFPRSSTNAVIMFN